MQKLWREKVGFIYLYQSWQVFVKNLQQSKNSLGVWINNYIIVIGTILAEVYNYIHGRK